MIEYGLLFGLGFLTAILAALLLAPAIHRRIVKFTEDRIMATMPVSPQELRAQKDMVRAEMAAAVARTGHDLKEERTKAAIYAVNNDRLSEEASRLYSDNSDLRIEMQEMTHAAAEMRASLRQEEINVEKLKELLSGSERNERTKDARITDLGFRVMAHARPPMVYDYGGFPPHTYHVQYPAPGAPALAARVQQLAHEQRHRRAAGHPAGIRPWDVCAAGGDVPAGRCTGPSAFVEVAL